MDYIEKANQLFNEERFHCSQSVFGAFAEKLGLSEEQALKIGGCFGGGMNEGEVCGCVTGALMVLGLKYGQCTAGDWESRNKSRDLCMEFYERFKAENGSCICRDLLGYDFGNLEETKTIVQTQIFMKICPKLVESAVRITEEMI